MRLLKIDLPDLPAIELGRSDTLEIGEVVLAIGNSYGLSQTVTLGIISATGRGLGLTNFENFIQTDAAINIGNSGGALVNTQGELIGINTARFAALNQSAPDGIGFAIPVNLVRGVMEELIEHGRVIRGWLGVDTRDLPSSQAESAGVAGSAVELLQVKLLGQATVTPPSVHCPWLLHCLAVVNIYIVLVESPRIRENIESRKHQEKLSKIIFFEI